jgi:hypothetical protein
MKVNVLKYVFACFLSVAFLSSCSDSDSEVAAEGTSEVQFRLVDAPGDYQEVNVEIVDVQYNNSEDEAGWRSFTSFSGPVVVDLTTLIAGNSLILSDEVIASGMLKQVRLVLGTNNTVLIEGETTARPLNTPSAQQSGLKLTLDQELEPGFTYSFILDWDVQNSVVAAGNSGNYNLRPVIRATAESTSGSIAGEVSDDNGTTDTSDDSPLAGATVTVYTSTDAYVAQTTTDAQGRFLLQGLPTDDYIVNIEKDGYIEYVTVATVSVGIGEIAELGTILLLRN